MTTFILGNWKMNTALEEAIDLLAAIPASSPSVRVGVAPPFPWIVPLRDRLGGREIWIGAQTALPQPSGAFTGDVSVAQIAPYIDFGLVGHSEQRQYHPVAAGTYGRVVDALIEAGKTAVLCVGERIEDRQDGIAEPIVAAQLADALGNEGSRQLERLIVAYEPVWAIGTGEAATADDAEAMTAFIDRWLVEHLGAATGSVPILYGGSANAANAGEYLAQPHVAGLLVGSASLKAESFAAIVAAAG